MKILIFIFLSSILLTGNILQPYTIEGKILQTSVNKFEKKELDTKQLLSSSKKYYFETGKLHIESIKKSKDSFLIKSYYESGQLHLIVNYVSGKKNGTAKVYYENGTLAGVATYVNGAIDGRYEEYYKNSKIHYQKNFVEGILEIPVIVYDTEGNKSYQLDADNTREVCY